MSLKLKKIFVAVRCPYGRQQLASTDDVMQQNTGFTIDGVTQCYTMALAQNLTLTFDLDQTTSLASIVVSVRNCGTVLVVVTDENGQEIQVFENLVTLCVTY